MALLVCAILESAIAARPVMKQESPRKAKSHRILCCIVDDLM
jgi:hypothetical protein